jgi:hypothetical protein
MAFDAILVADWSAAAKPTSATRRHDAIWIAEAGGAEHHFRTRHAAEVWLTERLAALSGARVLLGFDFAFGWPGGFARALTGCPQAQAVWAHLAAELHDAPDNANNRFAVAAAINRRFGPLPGQFWSRPPGLDLPDLPARRHGIDLAALGLQSHRAAERITQAKSVWMLSNPGAVGGQSLMGQALLHRLSQRFAPHIWPFDPAPALITAPLVLAEVYPSLLGAKVGQLVARTGIEKDRAQVRLLARALADLDRTGALAGFWGPLPPEAQEEGWILGAGHAEMLQAAAGPTDEF